MLTECSKSCPFETLSISLCCTCRQSIANRQIFYVMKPWHDVWLSVFKPSRGESWRRSQRHSLPKHLRPLSDRTKPGGQMHWKPPGVLVQEPKRQMLGSSSHSFISAEQQSLLVKPMFFSIAENIYLSIRPTAISQWIFNKGVRDDAVCIANLLF